MSQDEVQAVDGLVRTSIWKLSRLTKQRMVCLGSSMVVHAPSPEIRWADPESPPGLSLLLPNHEP